MNLRLLLEHLIFPRSCPVCGAAATVICPECLEQAAGQNRASPVCLECGAFAPCEKHGRRYEVRPLTQYRDTSRDLLLYAKYQGSGLLARAMGRRLAPLLSDAGSGWNIVFIPPHIRLHVVPGGDTHLEWMARGLSEQTGFPVSRCLKWKHPNTPQKQQPTAAARRAMPRDSFQSKTPPRQVILLDDVYTTGTTLLRAAQCLYSAGAEKVLSVCWAAVELKA
ncbi:MAG: ComF family protein [Pyramidobacter sp.]|jgi:predicted amidophosphoribosyltransferase